MPKINSVKMIPEDNLSWYNHILYGLNFIEEILEQEPDKCFVSDETEMWHFGIDESKLRESLFYNYGYVLENTDEKLWKVLEEININLLEFQPGALYAFWAIPCLFCVSHSHPARDVFRAYSLARCIAYGKYDVIIELLTKERNKDTVNLRIFLEKPTLFDQEAERYEYIIPNENELDYQQIERIINKIDESLAQDKRILFHSQGRTDRLGLVLACWLVKHNLATQNNFIDKINQLREGVWANDDTTDEFQFLGFNILQQDNCDETRHVIKSKEHHLKVRNMNVVPIYFNKKMRKEIPYWTNNLSLKVDYTVDEEIAEIIEQFVSK